MNENSWKKSINLLKELNETEKIESISDENNKDIVKKMKEKKNIFNQMIGRLLNKKSYKEKK